MRNVILIALAVFIAVAGGGYCISWYAQAAQIRRSIEQVINKANEQQKYITYDAIETTGFPRDIYVSVVRPHFAGRVDTLLKTLSAQAHTSQPDATASLPEWTEDAKLDGTITIGVNALSDHYSLRVSGNWQRTSVIGGQTIAVVTQSAGDSLCTLDMAHSGGILGSLWDYHALLRDNARDFFHDVRALDCNGTANAVSDAASHAPLVTMGPWRFYVSSAPQGGAEAARVYLKISDVEVTPQGDAMMMLQHSAFSPNSAPVQYSLFGKQNVEMDLSYVGPADWQAAGKNPPLDIRLSTFNITNQLYNSTMNFFLSNGMSGADRVARVTFKAESNVSEQYNAMLQTMLHNFIQQIYAGKGPPVPLLQPYMQKYSADELYAIAVPAIPDFHSLGKLAQTLDLSYQGNAELTAGDWALSALELSASPYGITGSGNAKLAAGHPFPAGQMALSCSNCPQLIDDVIGYAARLQKAMSYFEPPEKIAAETPMDARLAEGVKGFLRALAEPAKEGDNSFSYTIVSDGAMGITVSGKSINDVLAMYKEYIGSVLQASQPASQPAVAPAPGR